MKNLLIVLMLGFAMLSCSMKEWVDTKFPPISVQDQREKAVQLSAEQLKTLGKPRFYAKLQWKDLSSPAVQEIEEKLNKDKRPNGSDIKSVKYSKLRLSVAPQGFTFSSGISLKTAKLAGITEVKLEGELSGFIGIGTKNGEIFFYPAFDQVKVSRLSGSSDKKDIPSVRSVLNKLLHTYIKNLNSVFKEPIKAKLGYEDVFKPELGQFKSEKGFSAKVSNVKEVDLRINHAVLLLEGDSLEILAHVEVGAPSTSDVAVSSPKGSKVAFSEYRSKFKSARGAFAGVSKEKTSIQLSKSVVADAFNATLAKVRIEFSGKKSLGKHKGINREIYLDKGKTDEIRRKAKCPKRNCSKECTRKHPYQTHSCMKRILMVKTNDPVCLAAKRTANAVIEAAKQLCISGCNTGAELNCAGRKVGSLLKSLLVGNGKIGQIKGEIDVNEARFKGILQQPGMSSDLSRMEFDLDFSADVDVSVRVGYKPYNTIGHLVCIKAWKKNIKGVVGLKSRSEKRVAQVSQKTEEGSLMLLVTVPPVSLDGAMKPSPVAKLLLDFEIAAKCILPVGATAFKDLMKIARDGKLDPETAAMYEGRFKTQTNPYEFDFRIPSSEMKVGKKTLKLKPLWRKESIGYIVSK